MDALKLRFRRDLVGSTKMQKNLSKLHDFLYVTAGLSFATMYTFRISDSTSIDVEYAAHLLFPKNRAGAQRTKDALDMMVEEKLISRSGRSHYLITRDLSELTGDDESFIWISLKDFNTIKDVGDRLAPDLFSFYLFLLATRNSRLNWVAGDRSESWLAETLRMGPRTVTKYIGLLQELKVLYVKPRSPKFGVNQTNIYGAYSDKDKIDQLVVETVEESKRGFKISVSRRYDEVIQRDGADYTVAELERLIEDVKEYNRLVEKSGTGVRKNTLVLEKIRDRLIAAAKVKQQEEEFNFENDYVEEQDDHVDFGLYEDEDKYDDDGIAYSTYDPHADVEFGGPPIPAYIPSPNEPTPEEVERRKIELLMKDMEEWEKKYGPNGTDPIRDIPPEALEKLEREEHYDPRENYDDWSPTPEGRKRLSAMGIVEPAEDESEDDEIDALFG